jgi:hypothetical protein
MDNGMVMQKMPSYIGTKIVCAIPMMHAEFLAREGGGQSGAEEEEGYFVVYPDGYLSWSPKETFEAAYRLISDSEKRLI